VSDSAQPTYVAAADIDHDGKVDILSAHSAADSFSVLRGNGAGGFMAAAGSPFSTLKTPNMLLTADVNNDGLPDVIVSGFQAATMTAGVNVYLNQSTPGNVAFAAAKPIVLGTTNGPQYLVTGHFAGDANLDLAMVNPKDDLVYLYAGNGAGVFTVGTTSYTAGAGAMWPSAGNLNGDGVDDLVIVNQYDNDLTMLLSNGGAGFSATTLARAGATGFISTPNDPPTLLDVNGDGLTDILVAASDTSMPGAIEKLVNSGVPATPAFPSTPNAISTMDLPVAQAFADFNCDGVPDVAVSTNGCTTTQGQCPGGNNEPSLLWVMPGSVAGGYGSASSTSIPIGTRNIAIADFNNDGYADIITGAGGTEVTLLMNTP
jgi:hypothetical protein